MRIIRPLLAFLSIIFLFIPLMVRATDFVLPQVTWRSLAEGFGPKTAAPPSPLIVEAVPVPEVLAVPVRPSELAVASPTLQQSSSEMATMTVTNTLATSGESNSTTSMISEIKGLANQIRALPLVDISQPARVGTSSLPKTLAGVPQFKLTQKQTIPLLDIGSEPSISAREFTIKKIEIKKWDLEKTHRLSGPELMDKKALDEKLKTPPQAVGTAKTVRDSIKIKGSPVTKEKLAAVTYEIKDEPPIVRHPIVEIDDSDLKLVAALAINKQGDKCHVSSGLYFDLIKNPKVSIEASFYLGECLKKMGLWALAAERLIFVAKNAPNGSEWIEKSLKVLTDHLPFEFQKDLAAIMNKTIKDPTVQGRFYYYLAKLKADRGQYAESLELALKVPTGHSLFPDSQYLVFLSHYGLGKFDKALATGVALTEVLKKGGGSKEVRSILPMNIARVHFQKGEFSEANSDFLKTEKNHPLWLQGLIEQAWAQLRMGDYAGAVGNMFSVHTPYFKAIFEPETFVIRAIGYIKLCHFGDAYKVIRVFENKYKPWFASIEQYRKTHPSGSSHYETVKKYLSMPSESTVEGLPYQVLREMARHKDFLNVQEGINRSVDELDQWNYIPRFISKEISELSIRIVQVKKQIAGLRTRILAAKHKKEQVKFLNQWMAEFNNARTYGRFLAFQLEFAKEAKISFKDLSELGRATASKTKSHLKASAEKILYEHLADMQANLSKILENNELLKYEVYSGSGENIRFQVVGGQPQPLAGTARLPAAAGSDDGVKWDFDGEFWEDEIGHYRSSLKSACAQAGT